MTINDPGTGRERERERERGGGGGGGGGVAIKVTRMLKILNTTTETYQSGFFL